MILAGDIGGTKTNLALYKVVDGVLALQTQQQFSSGAFESFDEVIAAFLQNSSHPLINAACFGIAGAIIDAECKTTNLPWHISTSALQKSLATQNVRLMNDLEATAYGMLYLPEESFVELNKNAQNRKGNKAVIAAGTGLGEGMLFYDGESYHPLGSEGGHSDFAPTSPLQDALLLWLRRHYPAHVSYERILSGPGIAALYDFLQEELQIPEPLMIQNAEKNTDKSALISRCALEHNDALCLKTLELFTEIYGAEAGNLALKSLSLGGVYIGGGIAPKILSLMQQKHFMQGFVSKGRFEEMLMQMSVKISLNAETALLGAAHFAKDRF
ncbi:MAG: glucokinase [Sulfurimonas sp.]|nr:glucokinase [Sulfurimonas sp.]MDD5201850.1 glucokinase [Sulfurimonas sp.]